MTSARLLPIAVLCLAGCHRSPSPGVKDESASFPDQPPVVQTAPVNAENYDAGYKAGYDLGFSAATSKAKVPSEAEVADLAAEMAGTDPRHDAGWRRGWNSGYREGFQARAMHVK